MRLAIVVPLDEDDGAVQPASDVLGVLGTPEGKVPQVEHHILVTDDRIPVRDHLVVHLTPVGKGALAVLDYIRVTEVRIRSEEDHSRRNLVKSRARRTRP